MDREYNKQPGGLLSDEQESSPPGFLLLCVPFERSLFNVPFAFRIGCRITVLHFAGSTFLAARFARCLFVKTSRFNEKQYYCGSRVFTGNGSVKDWLKKRIYTY